MAPINTFRRDKDSVPTIPEHALIGNLKTAAMISLNGSVESMCMPNFDSPSVFARMLDRQKGGHFSISPVEEYRTKQSYLPNSNVLATKFLNEEGVALLTDTLLPRGAMAKGKAFLPWMIRRVEVVAGKVKFRVEVAPAFDYARAGHKVELVEDKSQVTSGECSKSKVLFTSDVLTVDLRTLTSGHAEEQTGDSDPAGRTEPQSQAKGASHGPEINWQTLDLTEQGHKGLGQFAEFEVSQGEVVDFVFREVPEVDEEEQSSEVGVSTERAETLGVGVPRLAKGVSKLRPDLDPVLSPALVSKLLQQSDNYWTTWIGKCCYTGRWREVVKRQALTLKMTIFEETGAIIAAPTFGLPEEIGGERNYDYRYTWIRDSSFTLYALIRLGYTDEANAFMDFIHSVVCSKNRPKSNSVVEMVSNLVSSSENDGSMQIMYTIHGGYKAPEVVLNHLEGHRGSKPVRIGNAAVDHLQLDIYGELLDAVYLAQKYSQPLAWDKWVEIRKTVDYVVNNWDQPDLSIWEVRNQKQNFLYSKVMCWVAIDRGLRLADKNSLPLSATQRSTWLTSRDEIYEEVMEKGWNKEEEFFSQSYEGKDVADSAVLIMPLCFFISAADPRFRKTMDRILSPPEKGGLTQNNLVHRYDTSKVNDGMGGSEGAFSLCTLWAIEALARAGVYDKELLTRANDMLTDFLGYGNHVGLFSEEISVSGEGLGNTPQGFSAVTLISTIFNLSRAMDNHF